MCQGQLLDSAASSASLLDALQRLRLTRAAQQWLTFIMNAQDLRIEFALIARHAPSTRVRLADVVKTATLMPTATAGFSGAVSMSLIHFPVSWLLPSEGSFPDSQGSIDIAGLQFMHGGRLVITRGSRVAVKVCTLFSSCRNRLQLTSRSLTCVV